MLQAEQIVSKRTRSCAFTICSANMAADLVQHGVLPNKTLSTKPARVTAELERHYWRGVLDGDGSIYSGSKQVGLSLVGDYEIVLGFQAFVLGHCPKVKVSILRHENIYSFSLTNGSAIQMLEVLYREAKVYLERKYRRAYQIMNPVDLT